jgi:hypothetical protein
MIASPKTGSMLLVLGWFMVLEPREQITYESLDLLPEHANSDQHSCEASDDGLNDKAASPRIYIEVSSSRPTQKEHSRNKRHHY